VQASVRSNGGARPGQTWVKSLKRSSSSLSDDDSNFASRFFFVLSFVMAPARPVAQGLPHGPSPRASRRRHAHRHRLPSLARPLLWGADVGQREIGLHDCVYDRGACARARTRNQGEPEVPPGGTWRSSTLRAATHWTGGARASSLPRPPPSRPHSVPRTGFAQGRVQWGATRRRRGRRSAPRPSREGPRRPLPACTHTGQEAGDAGAEEHDHPAVHASNARVWPVRPRTK
jgi:hypothetical protein